MKLWRVFGGIAAILVVLLAVVYIVSDVEKTTLDDKTRADLPGQFVELSKGTVHYELAGPEDGSVIVLVHGFSVPYYVWDPTFEALVGVGFQVLRYDFYGRGYSDRPKAVYNLDLFSEQLAELLLALDIDGPISLVGLSFGGPVVSAFANRYADRVRSIIFIDPQISQVSTKDIFPMNLPVVGEYLMGVYVVPVMLPKSQSGDFFQPTRFPNWELAYREQMQYSGFRRALLSSMRATVGVDHIAAYEAVGKTGYPVALFWGREDQTIAAEEIAVLRGVIPEIQYNPIDQAGHLPHYERPEAVNPVMIEFLKRVDE